MLHRARYRGDKTELCLSFRHSKLHYMISCYAFRAGLGTKQIRKRWSPVLWRVMNRGGCKSCHHRSMQMKETVFLVAKYYWRSVTSQFPYVGKSRKTEDTSDV